jgi:PAS domain S-box-containing protein
MSDVMRSHEKVEESTANLQAILNTVIDAIVTIDERGIILSANRATERMFGYARQEMVGRNVSLLMPPPYRDEHDQYLANYLASGEAKIIGIGREVTALKKDGTAFPIDLAVSEVVSGKTRQFTGVIRDTTDRKQAEEKLVQSERLAAIGQMVTGLAHESRNALQRARACLDMLTLDLGDQPRPIELTGRIQTALDELQRLYEEVRGYASPIKLSPGRCDLAEVWRTAWQQVVQTHDHCSVSLVEEGIDLDTLCVADGYRIEQVFRNVFENAVAVSPAKGRVTLRCREGELDEKPALCLTITDQGPGLTPEQVQRIFEPFYTTKQKGSGLGMPISQRIIDAHGGTIRVVPDTAHKGATIEIALPRSQA